MGKKKKIRRISKHIKCVICQSYKVKRIKDNIYKCENCEYVGKQYDFKFK